MPFPNHFKKSPATHLGCLRLGNISIAVEDGWSGTGYRLDYGPTITSGFFAGAYVTGSTFYGGQDVSLSTFGVVVNFTGNSPSFTRFGENTQESQIIYDTLFFPGASTAYTPNLIAISSQRPNKDVIVMENNLYPMVTSGLTCFYPFTWTYVKIGYSGTTFFNPMIDLTYNQNLGSIFNQARPAGQARVRGSNNLVSLDGVSTSATISGSTNILTGTDFTWFMYHNVSIPGGPGGNQYIWSSVSDTQKNFAIKYYCAQTLSISMVIETGSNSYSSTTSGTNFSGFSSNIPEQYFFNSYVNPRHTVLRKSGSTFNLYWWQPGTSYSNLTKMWEVTINDWSYVNNTIPIQLYRNSNLNYYTSGGLYNCAFYNRALSENEIRVTLSGTWYTTINTQFSTVFPTLPS